MTKKYYYNGNLVRKSTSVKNNYKYAIVGNYEDGTFHASSCSCDYNRLAKELADWKAYYTIDKVEKAREIYEHPETSEMWSYWQKENACWTKEEVLHAIKRDLDMYESRYHFWKNAKVVELEVVIK